MEGTLLLAATFEPLGVITWQDAIRLLTLEKIEVVEEYDKELRSAYLVIKMPSVVRLLSMFKRPKRKIRFSRVNVYIRDKYQCQYCGKSEKPKNFTLDHVIPRSRGGKASWKNIVTCCKKCNGIKGCRTPREARMQLIQKPFKPTWLPINNVQINKQIAPTIWIDYLRE